MLTLLALLSRSQFLRQIYGFRVEHCGSSGRRALDGEQVLQVDLAKIV